MLVWTVTSLTFGIAVYYLFGHSTQTVVTANVAHDIFLRPVDGMRPYSLAAAAACVRSTRRDGDLKNDGRSGD